MEKNNYLSKLLISNASEKERVEKKYLINSEINGIISLEEKKSLFILLRKLLMNVKIKKNMMMNMMKNMIMNIIINIMINNIFIIKLYNNYILL